MMSKMVGSVLTLISLLFNAGDVAAQTYTQMQWGMNKAGTPYQFGANINGAWYNLGTVTSAGVWNIPPSNITGLGTAALQNIGTSGANVPLLSTANTWGALQTFSSGISTAQLPGLTDNVQFTGIPGMTNLAKGWFLFTAPTSPTVNNPDAVFRVQRNDNYTGGTGVVKASWTACNTAAGQTHFVFCGLDTLNNIATGTSTNMVARYSQAFRQVGAAATWASAMELRDYQPDPTIGVVTNEIDMFGYDGDVNSQRVGLDLIGGPIPGIVGHNPTIGVLLRLGAQNQVAVNATVKKGISFTRATWSDSLIGAESSVAAVNGIDISPVTFSGCAVCLGGDHRLAFDKVGGTYSRYLRQSTGLLVWHSPSGDVWRLSDAGNQIMSGWLKTTSTTIAGLPACVAGILGAEQLVSNGTDYVTGTYGSAVAAAGAVTRKVLCTNTGGPTTYAWAYN